MACRLLVSCIVCYVGSLDTVLLWKQKLVKSSRTSLTVADQHVLVYTHTLKIPSTQVLVSAVFNEEEIYVHS